MFGSDVIDLALGLTVLFLTLSLIATAIREVLEGFVKSRAVQLERGIRELLDDATGDGIAKAFYEHPLIYALYRGEFSHDENRKRGDNLPTYIPARNFALAVIDLALRGTVPAEYGMMQTAPALTVNAVRAGASRLRNPRLVRAVLTAADHAGNDVEALTQNLQMWFDSSMDRVSGWYKRRTQWILFGIGFVLAAAMNVDTLTVTRRLWVDKDLRHAVAARAATIATDPTYKKLATDTTTVPDSVFAKVPSELLALKLPIGWDSTSWAVEQVAWDAGFPRWLLYWLLALIGYFLVGFAVSLGAPFWFDTLNKIMVIRSTVKPHEKSPEEASDDLQSKQVPTPPATNSPATIGTAAAARPSASPTAASVIRAGAAPTTDAPLFAPHEWATGEPQGGVL